MINMRDTHELREENVYYLDGIYYLPHYRNPHVYIGPGYPRLNVKRYSEKELAEAGAKITRKMLWPRNLDDVVTDSNP